MNEIKRNCIDNDSDPIEDIVKAIEIAEKENNFISNFSYCIHDSSIFIESKMDSDIVYLLTCTECGKILSVQEEKPGTFSKVPIEIPCFNDNST